TLDVHDWNRHGFEGPAVACITPRCVVRTAAVRSQHAAATCGELATPRGVADTDSESFDRARRWNTVRNVAGDPESPKHGLAGARFYGRGRRKLQGLVVHKREQQQQ